jgi:antitoxin ParD1/3/4
MTTMNVSLPDELKRFVDDQVASRGFGTSSEYVRELLRREQDRQRLRRLVLDGIASGRGGVADAAYFQSLRDGIAKRPPVPKGPAKKSLRRR